jgi:hypothetical protein
MDPVKTKGASSMSGKYESKMKRILVTLFFLSLMLTAITAQVPARKQYRAVRITTAPQINGILDDQAWNEGTWEGDFTQWQPYNGRPASQKTEFKIVFDENNLYVAIKAYDTSPDSIIKRLTRRDQIDGDNVGIIFDSYHDLRTGFWFGVSAGGVKYDEMMTNDGNNEDTSWDPNWWVRTSITKEGLIAEMKIPFSQLRFDKNSGVVWGLEVIRILYRKNEFSLWQAIPRDSPGIIHLVGELTGLENVKPRKIFDVTPYGVAKLERYKAEPGNPFLTGKGSKLKGGLDAKIGVTNNLTLDLTVNPDFGQVEADPSVVNLTAYETFFEEKRPFFIEGNNITNFGIGIGDGGLGNDNLFYSRRIGRRPQGSVVDFGGHYDVPINASIIGAAKLTGKTKNGLSVGFLDAVTAEEKAEVDTNGTHTFQTVEPLTNYMVGRIQKDINSGNTIIGGMVTSVNRDMKGIPLVGDESENLINRLPESAYTGGLDFTQYFKNKTYMFNVNAAFSQLNGTELAIVKAQRSSARYFQRPGNYVSLDSTRTSLSGSGGRVQFVKAGKGRFQFMTALLWKTPGFEINDLGYQRDADQLTDLIWVGYRLYEPKSFYRQVNLNFNQYSTWNFTGNHLSDGGNINGYISFKNYWEANGGNEISINQLSGSLLRGGPLMKLPGVTDGWFYIGTDTRKKLIFSINASYYTMFRKAAHNFSLSPTIKYKPTNLINVSVSPSYSKAFDELQYVTQTNYGSLDRYVFASIDQKTISMSLRVNINITPDLTVQYWGQPFIASGKYYDFKYINDPVASDYNKRFTLLTPSQIGLDNNENYRIDENLDGNEDYSFGKPDFNVRDFLSNLVIRWEYNPGSSVYLVWSQTRSGFDPSGTMDYYNDMGDLFHYRPHNVFLVKFSYRFGLK